MTMSVEMKTVMTAQGGPTMVAKEMRHMQKDTLAILGRHWHQRYLPDHFTRPAAARYGYKKRTRRWIGRKLRETGQATDLVYSGNMRRMLERASKITSTSKGVRVLMYGPRYLHMYRPKGKEPHKAEEVTATSDQEQRNLSRLYDVSMTRRMNNLRTTERRVFS